MPRSKQPAPASSKAKPSKAAPSKANPPKAIPPSRTSHLFASRKPNDRSAAVTSDRIADDLETFRKSGGKIEVLGITRTLIHIGTGDGTPPVTPPAPPPRNKRR